MDDASGIISLNSPGGSTLQWGIARGLPSLAPLVCFAVSNNNGSENVSASNKKNFQ